MAVVDACARFRIAERQNLLELLGRIALADPTGLGVHGPATVSEKSGHLNVGHVPIQLGLLVNFQHHLAELVARCEDAAQLVVHGRAHVQHLGASASFMRSKASRSDLVRSGGAGSVPRTVRTTGGGAVPVRAA